MHSGIFFLLAMELLYKSIIALVVVVLLANIATAVVTYGTQPSASCLRRTTAVAILANNTTPTRAIMLK